MSASDSNLRRRKAEWFPWSGRGDYDLPRPILISSPQRRIASPADRRRNAGLHRFLISGPNLGIDARFCLFTPSFVHRFLISGSDLRIDARISPFTPSCVHRFLISGPNLGIDAKKPSRTAQRLHRFLISSPDLRIDAASSLLQLRTARLQHHRSCTEERPACRMTVADAGGGRIPRRRHNPK